MVGEEAIHRHHRALKRAEESIYIDTTDLTEDELTKVVIGKINEKYKDEKEL